MTTKISSANTDSSIALSAKQTQMDQNIGLLGFKIAVNEGLTVYNLVDGIVDEFNDESGISTPQNSNASYCATCDYYSNCAPGAPNNDILLTYNNYPGIPGYAVTPAPAPTGVTLVNNTNGYDYTVGGDGVVTMTLVGAGGNTGYGDDENEEGGGGGGATYGTFEVASGDSLHIITGAAHNFGDAHPNYSSSSPVNNVPIGGGGVQNSHLGGAGGGFSGVFAYEGSAGTLASPNQPLSILIAGGGGGGAEGYGGNGGGPTGQGAETSNSGAAESGAGGTQSGPGYGYGTCSRGGGALYGGPGAGGSGGGGYYGGGGSTGGWSGGGGSGYVGGTPEHTVSNSNSVSGLSPGVIEANDSADNYPGAAARLGNDNNADYNDGYKYNAPGFKNPNFAPVAPHLGRYLAGHPALPQGTTFLSTQPSPNGYPGFSVGAGARNNQVSDGHTPGVVLLSLVADNVVTSTSTLTSAPFGTADSSVPTSSRIVVFAEIGSETLNTDFIAKVSRDNGSTYTNVSLTDSGYVTGTSGQKIYTGTVDVSGQPSGNEMRYQIAGANLTTQVKVHGVALQWS